MKYHFLGSSALKVSELCFGVMTFGETKAWTHVGAVGVAEADRHLSIAIEAGVNFFDTADVYADGQSEEVFAKALGNRRKQVIIATKVGNKVGDGPNDVGLSRHRIIQGCEDSLRRLGTDYIDLYQAHCFDPSSPQEETLRAFDDLVRQGKVRYVGCSNYTGWHLMKALAVSDRLGLERFVSHQARYNLVARDLEYELVPLSLDQDVGILVWGPLEGGFLTGKYRRAKELPPGVRLTDLERQLVIDLEKGYDVVETLVSLGERLGRTPSQVALNWLRRKPGVSSIVFGARSESQLRDNLAAVDWELSDEDFQTLEDLTRLPKLYPHWFIEYWRSDRKR